MKINNMRLKTLLLVLLSLNLGLKGQSFDTTGLHAWPQLFNSYESWLEGAFDRHRDANDFTDFGWGNYDLSTHLIEGDSIYILETIDGTFKAISINRLASGEYTLSLGNLDGSGRITRYLDRTPYEQKNFFYYSVAEDTIKDLEPARSDWDLVFTKYPIIFPGFGAYPVAGVLHNLSWEVAQIAHPSAQNPSLTDTLNHPFSLNISTIGYDWKDAFAGVVFDTISYYLRDTNNPAQTHLLQFQSYSGSATGNYGFSVDGIADSLSMGPGNDRQVYYRLGQGVVYTNNDQNWDLALSARRSFNSIPVRINDAAGARLYVYPNTDISAWQGIGLNEQSFTTLSLFPNPGKERFTLALHTQKADNLKLELYALSGALVWQKSFALQSGLQELSFQPQVPAGSYLLIIHNGKQSAQEKLIIQP